MAKVIQIFYSDSRGASGIYGEPYHDEKDFLSELNTGVMRKKGARLVSYTGNHEGGFKAVIEIDN